MALHLADHPQTDDAVQRQARALHQHHRVMEEAAIIARITKQARNRAAAVTVHAKPTQYPNSVRSRVQWERAS